MGDVEEEQPEGPGMPTMRNLLTKETYVEAGPSRARVARMNTDEKQDNGQDSPMTKQHSTSFAGSFIASLRRKASKTDASRRAKN